MGILELAEIFSYFLSAVAFVIRDIFKLRIVAILGFILVLIYDHRTVPLVWNSLFIVINTFQCILLYVERRPIKFTDDEMAIYSQKFRGMPPHKFKKLLKAGGWQEIEPYDVLVVENEQPTALILIYKGVARVVKNDDYIAELRPGTFVGEMSMIAKKPASATVTAGSRKMKVFYWPLKTLLKILNEDQELSFSLHSIMGLDMASKLSKEDDKPHGF